MTGKIHCSKWLHRWH